MSLALPPPRRGLFANDVDGCSPGCGEKPPFVTAVTKYWVSNVTHVTVRIPNLVNSWRQETGVTGESGHRFDRKAAQVFRKTITTTAIMLAANGLAWISAS